MKGKISFSAKNRHITFRLELERNVTVITGDSGTGKTKLINMVRAYSLEGKNSGVTIRCDRPCVVLEGVNWLYQLENIKSSVVFIEESTKFVPTHEFAEAVRNTDNYYVLITREDLPQISYSVDSIKKIVKNDRLPKIEKIYGNVGTKDITKKKYDLIITEDSKSGYIFFAKAARNLNAECVSAFGKSNIVNTLEKCDGQNILIIADAAAFGSEIRELIRFINVSDKKVDLFLPESFEWLILKSEIFDNNDNVRQILKTPVDFIESGEYFSWERFFTALLVNETEDRPNLSYSASKNRLPSGYLTDKNIDGIINAMTDNK